MGFRLSEDVVETPGGPSLSGNNPYYNESLMKGTQIADSITGSLAAGIGLGDRIKSEMDFYRDFNVSGGIDDTGPYYNQVSQLRQETAGLEPDEAGKGLVGQSAMTGAKIGGSLAAINPVLGAVGAGVGAVGGAIFGAVKKNKIQDEATSAKNKALAKLAGAQKKFNTNTSDYYKNVTGKRQQQQEDRSYLSRSMGGSSPYQSLI